MIYDNVKYDNSWDGMNGATMVPSGLYYYVVKPEGGNFYDDVKKAYNCQSVDYPDLKGSLLIER